jgi:hypothetical protein
MIAPRVRLAVSVGALVGLSLLGTGCGGSTSASVASIATTSTPTTGTNSGGALGTSGASSGNVAGRSSFALVRGSVPQMTKFAACVRSHGEPNFPDPNAQGQFSMSAVIAGGIDPRAPQLGQAVQACEKDLPKSGPTAVSPAAQAQARQQLLQFSACMRSHGAPNFPDPPPGGQAIRILPGSGIDPQSPQYQAATTACQKYLSKGSKLGPSAGP